MDDRTRVLSYRTIEANLSSACCRGCGSPNSPSADPEGYDEGYLLLAGRRVQYPWHRECAEKALLALEEKRMESKVVGSHLREESHAGSSPVSSAIRQLWTIKGVLDGISESLPTLIASLNNYLVLSNSGSKSQTDEQESTDDYTPEGLDPQHTR